MLAAAAITLGASASAQVSSYGDKQLGPANETPSVLQKVGIKQNLNTQLPLGLTFTDDQGKPVQLASYFGKRPSILALVYYQCPMLCSEELNGLTGALEMVNFTPGKDFDVIVVSIDPTEGTDLAAAKKRGYLKRYGRPGDSCWLALPHRHAGQYRRVDQGRRIRLCEDSRTRWKADAVCACQLYSDRYVGGQAGAVLHGRRILAQGYAARPD